MLTSLYVQINYIISGKKGGAIHFEGNGNVDDSQFTNKTSGNSGTDSN